MSLNYCSLQDHEDKILALKEYLEFYSDDDEGDSWIYGHNPNIVAHLNSLSAEMCKKLTRKVLSWPKESLYNLADPLLEESNPYLDGAYLYGEIFLAVDDVDMEEYLVGNLHVFTWTRLGEIPIDFYFRLQAKIIEYDKVNQHKYGFLLKLMTEKIVLEESIQ